MAVPENDARRDEGDRDERDSERAENEQYTRFEDLARKLVKVPKAEIDEQRRAKA